MVTKIVGGQGGVGWGAGEESRRPERLSPVSSSKIQDAGLWQLSPWCPVWPGAGTALSPHCTLHPGPLCLRPLLWSPGFPLHPRRCILARPLSTRTTGTHSSWTSSQAPHLSSGPCSASFSRTGVSELGTGLSELRGTLWAPEAPVPRRGQGSASPGGWGGDRILIGKSTFSEQAPQTLASGRPEDGGRGPQAMRRVGTVGPEPPQTWPGRFGKASESWGGVPQGRGRGTPPNVPTAEDTASQSQDRREERRPGVPTGKAGPWVPESIGASGSLGPPGPSCPHSGGLGLSCSL